MDEEQLQAILGMAFEAGWRSATARVPDMQQREALRQDIQGKSFAKLKADSIDTLTEAHKADTAVRQMLHGIEV